MQRFAVKQIASYRGDVQNAGPFEFGGVTITQCRTQDEHGTFERIDDVASLFGTLFKLVISVAWHNGAFITNRKHAVNEWGPVMLMCATKHNVQAPGGGWCRDATEVA